MPGFSVVKINGADLATDMVSVAIPDEDSQKLVGILGPSGVPAADGPGEVSIDYPLIARYDSADGTPAVGEQWGTEAGSLVLHKGKIGFLIIGGADTTNYLVTVMLEVCRFE